MLPRIIETGTNLQAASDQLAESGEGLGAAFIPETPHAELGFAESALFDIDLPSPPMLTPDEAVEISQAIAEQIQAKAALRAQAVVLHNHDESLGTLLDLFA